MNNQIRSFSSSVMGTSQAGMLKLLSIGTYLLKLAEVLVLPADLDASIGSQENQIPHPQQYVPSIFNPT